MKKIAILGLFMAVSGSTFALDNANVNCEDTGTDVQVSSADAKAKPAEKPAGESITLNKADEVPAHK